MIHIVNLQIAYNPTNMDFDSLREKVLSEKSDYGKNKVLKSLVESIEPVLGYRITEFLKEYADDKYRTKGLQILEGKIILYEYDCVDILKTFKTDDERFVAFKILERIKRINPDLRFAISETFTSEVFRRKVSPGIRKY